MGTDLFQYGNKNYLIIADYYSLYPEVYLLDHPNSEQVIEVTKDVFARHGVPQEVISDNGTQYSSPSASLKTGNLNIPPVVCTILNQMAWQSLW